MHLSFDVKGELRIGKKFLLSLSFALSQPEKLKEQIEADPLFSTLLAEGVIRRCTLPPLYPSFNIGQDSAWSRFLKEHEDVCSLLRCMGKDVFCKYFLFPQNIYSTEELQEHTGLSQEEIKKVQDFVDTLSLLPERVSPVFSSAKIVARMENELILLSPAYRTHYSINSKRCSKFIKDLKGKEKEKAQELLRKIKVLNTQKTVLFRLLEEIMQHQAEYLSTGDESKLKILTQRDVAQNLGVHPSWINRLIKQKYVETVWGTKPLRFFFQSKRDYLKRHLKELLEREWASDAELARILHESTGYKVRRRNLASMRKELWSQRA